MEHVIACKSSHIDVDPQDLDSSETVTNGRDVNRNGWNTTRQCIVEQSVCVTCRRSWWILWPSPTLSDGSGSCAKPGSMSDSDCILKTTKQILCVEVELYCHFGCVSAAVSPEICCRMKTMVSVTCTPKKQSKVLCPSRFSACSSVPWAKYYLRKKTINEKFVPAVSPSLKSPPPPRHHRDLLVGIKKEAKRTMNRNLVLNMDIIQKMVKFIFHWLYHFWSYAVRAEYLLW